MYDTPEERILWILWTLEVQLHAEEQYSSRKWRNFARQYTLKGKSEKR